MPLSRKNYLKKNNEVLESNDVKTKDEDLFDKLLSSPLKQEVSFQPLSFWKSKVQTYSIRKNIKKNSCWLYESSDSDDSSYKSPHSDSEPNWIFSESESSDNQTVLGSSFQSQANSTCVAGLRSDDSFISSTRDVTLVTDKINDMRLSCTTNSKDVLSETEISEEDLTNNNLTETSLLLDSRLVTKRRKYNFSNSVVSLRISPSHMDHASWVHLKSLARQSQYTDESFISDSKIFASTSHCHIPDERSISPLIRNRHVAIRKRQESSRRFSEANTESQDSIECSRISTASSLNLIDMSSETSSDVEYQGRTIRSRDSFLEESQSCLNSKVVLKPGKNWKRSMLILKHCGNNSLGEVSCQNLKIKGKKYKDFIESVMEMQNINSKTLHDTSTSDLSLKIKSSDESFTFESREAEKSVNDSENSKSAFDETFLEKTFLNRTVRVTQPEGTLSAFRTALGLEQSDSYVEDTFDGEITQVRNSSSLSARDFVLNFCNQENALPFEEHFNEETLKDCKKIGEGVYGEVFLCSDTVIKIIPIEGSDLVNGERQKTFEEIISEVVIASKLSNLRNGEKHRTSAFCEMKRCWCVKGKYPQHLIKLWEEYDKMGRSANESPIMFKEDQLYIILELNNAGQDLESFFFQSPRQSLSIFIQVAFGLAVAEKAFEFEHRDLHWGNVLVSDIDEKFVSVILDGVNYEIPSRGVKACIIDFTLSRITHDGCSVYNDLSVDPTLFAGDGDYQFDIYRMMLQEVQNEWSLFKPRNNLFWLHYILDKMICMTYYKNKKAKVYNKQQEDLKLLKSVILKYNDSAEFVKSDCIKNFVK